MAKGIDQEAVAGEFNVIPGKASWKGVNTHDDPSALEDNEWQDCRNVRIEGSKIIARGGQSKFIDAAIGGPGPVDGMWNASEDSSAAAYLMNTNLVPAGTLLWTELSAVAS